MRKKLKMKFMIVLIVAILVLVAAFFCVIPPGKGELPAFKGADGNLLTKSITEKTYVAVDGAEIGMIILGENAEYPVLLVCGGGPGIPEYLLESMYASELPKHFVVCYFDYRGTGLSFDKKICAEEMTTERYLADVEAITEYLKERFGQEKIYIMGHSFGTYIALHAVERHPESYTAYLAVSQICDQRESENRAYDYMYEEYGRRNNRNMVAKLEAYPIRESEEEYKRYCTSGLRDRAMHELGIGTTRDMKSVISGIFLPSLRCKAYTIGERINIWRGKVNANKFAVTEDAFHFRAVDEIKSIQVPIYFFTGEYDYTCSQTLQKEYYDVIDAPEKKYYLYSDAAHSPVYENPEMTGRILDAIITENK